MKQNFDYALGRVLGHEGGFSDHPEDNGGATMWGITHRTYDAYRRAKGLPTQSVRDVTRAEMVEIYRREYWDAVRADDLPSGVDYAVFDFAVNSGPGRAAKFAQRIIGAEVDGVIGSQTIARIWDADPARLIKTLCARRLAWMKTLSDWRHFGRGWTNRVHDLEIDALAMIDGKRMAERVNADPAPKTGAAPKQKPTARAKDNADTLTAGGVLTGLLGGATQTEGAVQLLLVVGVLALVGFIIWRKWKAEA